MSKKKEVFYDETVHPQYWLKDVWLNSQLSIARHYGGIKVGGVPYTIDELSGDLCRPDIATTRRAAYTEADKATIRERRGAAS